MNYKNIVQELAERRKNLRLCSRALSEKIGVSETAVSLWECGKKEPNARTLLDWCMALDFHLVLYLHQHAVPNDFKPSRDDMVWIKETFGKEFDYETERQIFVDHYKSVGGTKSDWHAAFRNWLRRSKKFANARPTKESNFIGSAEGIQARRERINNVTNLRLATQTKDNGGDG